MLFGIGPAIAPALLVTPVAISLAGATGYLDSFRAHRGFQLSPIFRGLVFPAWFQATRQRGGGIDLMGQRVIFGLGQLLTMLLALLPAVLVAGVVIFITQWLIGLPAAVLIAALTVIVILAGEIWCGLWWLGGRFEKLDLSAELRP